MNVILRIRMRAEMGEKKPFEKHFIRFGPETSS